jgi:predicted PurR-regulated permease PerM
MPEDRRPLNAWVTFAGCVLVVAVLYWARVVLVPVSLAVLLTFVLAPPVIWLQRRIGRIAAVLTVVFLVFTFAGLAGWGVVRQMSTVGTDIPTYRANIRAKLADIRGAQDDAYFSKFAKAIRQLQGDLGAKPPEPGTPAKPLVVTTETPPASGFAALGWLGWLGPLVGPLSTGTFVAMLVLFMLLEREQLRDTILGLVGQGRLARTTKALGDAGDRVSRQLLMQSVVNLIYGAIAAAGLWMFGVPYPLFWGAVGALLRFIPYLGPVSAAMGPVIIAFAALPGWTGPLEVAGFYVALEIFTNMFLETALYAGAMGVSQVALIVSVAFWTWLWGPVGLVMATPLTVCLVVLGKHVPGLNFLGTLLSDVPALTPDHMYYQRLLARDQADAVDIVERFQKAEPSSDVFEALLIPALNYAERDRLEGHLSVEEEAAVIDTTREVLDILAETWMVPAMSRSAAPEPGGHPLRVLGYAVNGPGDELALHMLAHVSSDLPIALDITTTRIMASELVEHIRVNGYGLICIADLPPSTSSKTRYLVKRLRAALPDVRIVVGRWAHASLADDEMQPLTEAGASHVSTSLLETRKYLAEAAHVGTAVVSETAA